MGQVLQFRRETIEELAEGVTSYEELTMEEAEEELRARKGARLKTLAAAEEVLLDVELTHSASHRRVLELHFGIGGEGPCDTFEIAVLMGVPTARVMRWLGEAIHFAAGSEDKNQAARKAA